MTNDSQLRNIRIERSYSRGPVDETLRAFGEDIIEGVKNETAKIEFCGYVIHGEDIHEFDTYLSNHLVEIDYSTQHIEKHGPVSSSFTRVDGHHHKWRAKIVDDVDLRTTVSVEAPMFGTLSITKVERVGWV